MQKKIYMHVGESTGQIEKKKKDVSQGKRNADALVHFQMTCSLFPKKKEREREHVKRPDKIWV